MRVKVIHLCPVGGQRRFDMTDSVTYSLGLKRSVKQYENYTPFYSVSRDLKEGETEQQVFDELEAIVEKRMLDKCTELDKDLG